MTQSFKDIRQGKMIHRLWVLYPVVFVSGFVVMVIELLGTRVIAPFFGTSLYVWASIISVTMIALAIGYYLGGVWSDRAKISPLPLVLLFSGGTVLLIPALAPLVLPWADPMGLRLGAFVSCLILFLPSLCLLGMVGPTVINHVAAVHPGLIGRSVGLIYAISTIGSVAGTLVLAFFLFPSFGSTSILLGAGETLVLTAMGVLGIGFPVRRWWVIFLAIAFVMAGLIQMKTNAEDRFKSARGFSTLSEEESLYGWVRVLDNPERDMRLLASDASVIGAARISDGKSLLFYQKIIESIPLLRPEVKRALLIGQGAGHIANELHQRFGIVVDTIELDPSVANAAESSFGFQASGKRLVGDARYEIRKLDGPYDLVIHDCFTGGTEPTHLLTKEAFQEAKRLLSPQGILALNYVAIYEWGKNKGLASVYRTLGQVFTHRLVIAENPQHELGDFVFLASASNMNLEQSQTKQKAVQSLIDRTVFVDETSGDLISDDYNPLEHYQLQKAESYRSLVVGWLGSTLMTR